jgi:uncharacterized membrane protein YhaH (DUF805 family)
MGISIFHWLILLIIAAIVAIPAARILRRTGFNPWLAILYVIPIVGWVVLWVFAYARWPKVDGDAEA